MSEAIEAMRAGDAPVEFEEAGREFESLPARKKDEGVYDLAPLMKQAILEPTNVAAMVFLPNYSKAEYAAFKIGDRTLRPYAPEEVFINRPSERVKIGNAIFGQEYYDRAAKVLKTWLSVKMEELTHYTDKDAPLVVAVELGGDKGLAVVIAPRVEND
jgi:hypothetical protein